MKVLVIGSGGREHAIAWKINQSSKLNKLFCAPGNAGTAQFANNVDISVLEIEKLAEFAKKEEIDLTIVGPEAPLAAGIVNFFEKENLKIFGPSKQAAELESSKSFAKEIMLASKVPTAKSEVFTELDKALSYIKQEKAPIVIKADGLAAGKGVTVALSLEQAEKAIRECLEDGRFGDSGARVLIEDFLDGKEASVMAIVDGKNVCPLVISQDYKRLLDGDGGPNTGGMGAISPTSVIGEDRLPEIIETVFNPVITELAKRGVEFKGFLYAGLMVSDDGTYKVLEFNCRLGDPETEVLLPRLESDLLEVLSAAESGNLASVELHWSKDACVGVVLASKGYPLKSEDKKEVSGISTTDSTTDLTKDSTKVFQCGNYIEGEKLHTKGGRVFVVTAKAESVSKARELIYSKIEKVNFNGMQYRKDIGVS